MKVYGYLRTALLTLASTLFVSLACRFFLFVPDTRGLLSMGEPIFLASAILLGPLSGAFIGGLGFAFADLLLGYPHYVFAALTVKSATGFAVGKLCRVKSSSNKFFGLASSLLLIIFFASAGAIIYSGTAYFGYARLLFLGESIIEHGGLDVWHIYIPQWFWIAVSSIMLFCLFFLEFKKKGCYGWISLSLLSGTLITALGYMLYEVFILPYFFDIKVDAAANIPINIGQTVLSAIIATLLVEAMHFGKFHVKSLKTIKE